VRTNRPNNVAEPRHRKPGPARLTGTSVPGQRVREDSEPKVDPAAAHAQPPVPSPTNEDVAAWQPTAIKR
jgi:hypothetical protein